jgi:hypothetical protein
MQLRPSIHRIQEPYTWGILCIRASIRALTTPRAGPRLSAEGDFNPYLGFVIDPLKSNTLYAGAEDICSRMEKAGTAWDRLR